MALEKRKRNIGIQGTKARFPDKRKRATRSRRVKGQAAMKSRRGRVEREKSERGTREEGRRRATGLQLDLQPM